jgi:hypothetical protein
MSLISKFKLEKERGKANTGTATAISSLTFIVQMTNVTPL